MSEQWGIPPAQGPGQQGPGQFPQYPPQGGQFGPGPGPMPGPMPGPGFGPGPGGYPGPGYGMPRNSKMAITAMILGIVSVCLFFIPVLGPLLGLLALIFGMAGIAGASQKNLKKGLGVAGIVLGALGLIGGGLFSYDILNAVNKCQNYHQSALVYNACLSYYEKHP